MRLLITIALCSLILGGCATITRGSSQTWVVDSDPTGADVRLSTGQTCVTPCTLNLKRKTAFTAVISKPGYASVSAPVSSEMKGSGITAFVGNIIFGGLIGIGVDLATGATKSLEPNPLTVEFQAEGQTGSEATSAPSNK